MLRTGSGARPSGATRAGIPRSVGSAGRSDVTALIGDIRPFDSVEQDHPFRQLLDNLRMELSAGTPAGWRLRYIEVRGRRSGAGWKLDSFCGTVGPPALDPAADQSSGYDASTMYWSAESGPSCWFRFPDDPRLPGAAARLRPVVGGFRRFEVLSYAPMRHLTVRTGPGGSRIVKFKRQSRLLDAWRRAVTVQRAAAGTAVRVPLLSGLDLRASSYTQLDVPGTSMARLIDRDNVESVLIDAGSAHAEFHTLSCRELPVEGPSDPLAGVARDADWLAALHPTHSRALAAIHRRLAVSPAGEAPLTTCHGNLLPSHLLADGVGWTIIDLDLAHVGNPYRDVAVFLSGLRAELADPTLTDWAVDAYLTGYRRRSPIPLDGHVLEWHRRAVDLRALAIGASTDRLSAEALEAEVNRLADRGGDGAP